MKNLRYERKFSTKLDDMKQMVLLIKAHKAIFKEAYEERRVNSIYFDTNGFEYYQDNLYGKSNRRKIRVRWYGDDIENLVAANLEIKSKNAHVGTKDTYNLGDNKIGDFLKNYASIIEKSDADGAVKKLFPSLRPVILVSYSRRYFISADRNYRITLDYDLRYWDLHTGFNPLKKIDTDICVVELKYSYDNDDLANTISAEFPDRYSKSSKYAIGIDLIL